MRIVSVTSAALASLLLLFGVGAAPAGGGAAAPTPAADRGEIVTHVVAQIDGTDELTIDRTACSWRTLAWGPPRGSVLLADRLWDVRATPRRVHEGALLRLGEADFSQATIRRIKGRDVVALETRADGMTLRFDDTPNGADVYIVEIRVPTHGTAHELLVEGVVDGSDVLVLRADGAQWIHRHWGRASEITLNGRPWDVAAVPLRKREELGDLMPRGVRLDTARLVETQGRGTVALDVGEEEVRLVLADNPVGAGSFRARIRFGRDRPPPRFRIVTAMWGTGHRWANVTDKAREVATHVGLETTAKRHIWGDPYPHFIKSLVVTYELDGKTHSAAFREDRSVVLPPSSRSN